MISAFTGARTHHGSPDDRQPLSTPRPGLGLLEARHNDTLTTTTTQEGLANATMRVKE